MDKQDMMVMRAVRLETLYNFHCHFSHDQGDLSQHLSISVVGFTGSLLPRF